MANNTVSKVLDVIKKRRSCRRFSSQSIPVDHIEMLIDALRWAPSAGNRQPWHFYIVFNQDIKNQLVEAARGQKFVGEPPVVFVVCTVAERSASRYGDRGETLYVYQDTAAAVQNLLITATDLGYGTCWVGAFLEESVCKVLNLPKNFRPVALIPVGIAEEDPDPPRRFSKETITTILQ